MAQEIAAVSQYEVVICDRAVLDNYAYLVQRAGLQAAGAPLRLAPSGDEPRPLQHLEVLGDGRQRHVEGLGKQLYPELNLWETTLPFLEDWQRQRLSPLANLRKIRERLPEGFQRAEYLKAHGMVDMVVPRTEMRRTLFNLCSILMKQPRPAAA